MGLLDPNLFTNPVLLNQLKGLLGNMPIAQLMRGEAEVSREGLLGEMRKIPVFDPSVSDEFMGNAMNAMNPIGLAGGLPVGIVGMARRQAKLGGEVAKENGYFYKGGQFLPSTDVPPGQFKIGGKLYKSTGTAEVAPFVRESPPTPLHRSIYELLGPGYFTAKGQDGRLILNPNLNWETTGTSPSTPFAPGVKGHLGTTKTTLEELLDAYGRGEKWFEVKIDS